MSSSPLAPLIELSLDHLAGELGNALSAQFFGLFKSEISAQKLGTVLTSEAKI